MPFTFSHPAVILPFKGLTGKRVSLTALALGSMAPDFEFFFRMRAETDISHTLKGIFLFDIPVVLLMAILYHCWIRSPLINHLPPFLRHRFSVYQDFDWLAYFKENWLVVMTSAFLGIVTHLLCDDFTHDYGWTAKNLPLLSSSYHLAGYAVPGYHLLQYLSSLVLGIFLVVEAFKLPRVSHEGFSSTFFLFWGINVLITIPTFILRFTLRDREMTMDDTIMTAIAAGLLGLLVAASVVNLLKK
ncbi:DUF4184 family protein [Rufibacter glacialis]|uniref:DUF4184 family protein n=1 Tax=Rufibacter glacialis TaxID=1259555 RepID=A0A5M8QHU7_9BACT|nr:DUF4184 family protein [Rufibacter glacialis]KAA6434510.1 DUF4184 family protein [Rufibacter glacialis]GGK70269.1 hypothetical protein GCM10011405_17910 [Rufibacter glacialis]